MQLTGQWQCKWVVKSMPLHILGGGVHLVGDSSSGKSPAQLIGSSVWGDPGVFRVVGGAGGKLNYLKLRGVKSESEYRSDAAGKAKVKRDLKRDQTDRDKASGIHGAKVAARQAIAGQRSSAEKDFVQTVADAMGW